MIDICDIFGVPLAGGRWTCSPTSYVTKLGPQTSHKSFGQSDKSLECAAFLTNALPSHALVSLCATKMANKGRISAIRVAWSHHSSTSSTCRCMRPSWRSTHSRGGSPPAPRGIKKYMIGQDDGAVINSRSGCTSGIIGHWMVQVALME